MNPHINFQNQHIIFSHNLDQLPDYNYFQMHMHEYCELYYMVKGRGDYRIEGNQYNLTGGELLLMRPSESHAPKIDPNYPYERMSIHFDRNLFSIFDPNNTLLEPYFNREVGTHNLYLSSDFLNNTHHYLLTNLLNAQEDDSVQIITNLCALLHEISLAFQNKSNHELKDSLSYQIVSYINKNVTNPLSLDQICAHFFISKSHLCRIFKEATGSTVADYINVKRVVYAKELMQQGEPATVAATLSGFNDYSIFYRNYKKKYGQSPSSELKGVFLNTQTLPSDD